MHYFPSFPSNLCFKDGERRSELYITTSYYYHILSELLTFVLALNLFVELLKIIVIPTAMNSMASISQSEFNQRVKENMDDFELTFEESLQMTIEECDAQRIVSAELYNCRYFYRDDS